MKRRFDIHGQSRVWLSISALLVTISIVLLFLWGLNLGLDFTGGTQMRIAFDNPVEKSVVESFVSEKYGSTQIVSLNEESTEWSIKVRSLSEEEHDLLIESLEEEYGNLEESGLMSIGPVVSESLRGKAFTALVVALIGMILYIAYEFRKLPDFLSSWKFGLVAVIALFHDVVITLGVFVVLGKYFGFEVDTFFVTALLTILGYSVNDTIVIFDKIREGAFKSKKSFKDIAEDSVWDSMTRSLNTSVTLLIALLALLIFGPGSLNHFVLALIIGAVVGTYSSIFVAPPLLVWWHKEVKRN